MKIQDLGYGSRSFKVVGLKQFAQTGLGDFVATRHESVGTPGVKSTEQLAVHMALDTLVYVWAESLGDEELKTVSRFAFTRKRLPN